MTNSVLRRYTPPTCTLEIVAKTSPLSRWVGQSVFKDLRFELHFDDPRQPDEKRVTIRGDRSELDVLYETVSHYVQEFLNSPSMPLPSIQLTAATDNDPIAEDNPDRISLPLPASGVIPSQAIATQWSEESPEKSDPKVKRLKPRTIPPEIHLKPKNLVAHQLFLGQLANEKSGPVVNLSALQLFDLATALDDYATEVVALPNLNRSRGQKAPPIWARAVAAVVLAVGVTTAGIKLLNPSEPTQQATTPSADESPTDLDSNIAQVPLAPTPPVLPSPLPTPVTPPSLSPAPTLPPPSPVQVPPPATDSPPPAPQPQSIPITPPPTQGSTSQSAPSRIASRPAPLLAPESSSPPASSSSANTQTPPTITNIPATPPPLPPLPSLKTAPSPPDAAERNIPIDLPPSVSSAARLSEAEPPDTRNGQESRLFDNIPQVAEVRNYLQQRWQPPKDLTRTLEYSIWLNYDGSIERIIPLGQAAESYIDRTSIPLVGEPFVSSIEGGGKPNIRVVLSPDGKVEVLLNEIRR